MNIITIKKLKKKIKRNSLNYVSYVLRSELSWTHYRLLMSVENKDTHEIYTEEAIKSNQSTRQLEDILIQSFMKGCYRVKIKKSFRRNPEIGFYESARGYYP